MNPEFKMFSLIVNNCDYFSGVCLHTPDYFARVAREICITGCLKSATFLEIEFQTSIFNTDIIDIYIYKTLRTHFSGMKILV